ncbi:hypothetical protein [Caryophanon tenue]|uniref:DUF4352 domain-containing protein n=1 Tax=Caryophanon tenue TaxID=33978 RepID=A0A1C0YDX4_9BACL|nr:hypothetical protein [Caryophanon tenue]OCS85377.1 hypothetical protein A6M13_13130 [Caryophanon tenue]
MKKGIIGLIILFSIVLVWVRVNPPLEYGTIAGNEEGTLLIVGVGNKGLTNIDITEVTINNGEKPGDVKVQVNHPNQGFVVTDDFSAPEVATYAFVDVSIAKGTDIDALYERQDNNEIQEDEKIYGLTLSHEQPIHAAVIHYRYLGMPYTLEVNAM